MIYISLVVRVGCVCFFGESRAQPNNQIMFVNKTVILTKMGIFYEAESQHAGSLNIQPNTEEQDWLRRVEQLLQLTPTSPLSRAQ